MDCYINITNEISNKTFIILFSGNFLFCLSCILWEAQLGKVENDIKLHIYSLSNCKLYESDEICSLIIKFLNWNICVFTSANVGIYFISLLISIMNWYDWRNCDSCSEYGRRQLCVAMREIVPKSFFKIEVLNIALAQKYQNCWTYLYTLPKDTCFVRCTFEESQRTSVVRCL